MGSWTGSLRAAVVVAALAAVAGSAALGSAPAGAGVAPVLTGALSGDPVVDEAGDADGNGADGEAEVVETGPNDPWWALLGALAAAALGGAVAYAVTRRRRNRPAGRG